MSPITIKIRLTIENDEELGTLVRDTFRALFGAQITLAKFRKGGNPKYADDPKLLAYGEIDTSVEELRQALASASQLPALPTTQPQRKANAYTQETIKITEPKRPRRKAT